MKFYRLLVFILLIVIVTYGIFRGFISHASLHANQITGVVLGGYERFTYTMTEMTLSHLANLPESKKMDPKACEAYRDDLENSKGFFAVLALGDKNGNAVCSADPMAKQPLPTMADRVYFQRVKNAQGLTLGEYAVSRTTGKQVIHFAYPVKANDGTFNGFVLGSINLDWFVDSMADEYFADRNVQLFAVDNMGKLLFSYPAQPEIRGKSVVPAQLVSAILSGKQTTQFLKGYDNKYRVFGYKPITMGSEEQIIYFVGVSLWTFRNLILFMVLFTVISFFLGLMLSRQAKKRK